MTQFTCFCCPCCPGLVSGTYSLQLTRPCCLPDEPLQPVSQEGRVDVLPDVPQHFLQHGKRKHESVKMSQRSDNLEYSITHNFNICLISRFRCLTWMLDSACHDGGLPYARVNQHLFNLYSSVQEMFSSGQYNVNV